ACQRAQLQERTAAVQEARHALARQKLRARLERGALGLGSGAQLVFDAAHLVEQRLHARAIGAERARRVGEVRAQRRHQRWWGSPASTAGGAERWKPSKAGLGL